MAAVTADKVLVELQAKIDSYLANVGTAERAFTKSTNTIDKAAAATSARVVNYFKQVGAAYLGVKGAQLAVELVDANNRIVNSLKVAGLAGQDLTAIYDRLYKSARNNGASFEGLATVYSRVSLATKDLGISSERVATLVDNVAKAVRTSGGDGAAATGALLQLSQAFGSNAIQAQEYNSLIDGLPTLLKAAASGIQEAGGSVAKLTQLVKDGKVSNKAFFLGIEAGAGVLDQQLKGSTVTAAQGFENLQTAAIKAAGELDKFYGITDKIGGVLSGAANLIDDLGAAFARNDPAVRTFNEILSKTFQYLDAISRAGTVSQLGRGDEMSPHDPGYQDALKYSTDPRFKYGGATISPTASEARSEQAAQRAFAKKLNPISLKDNPVLGKTTGNKKSPQQKFDKSLQDIKDSTAATNAERDSINLSTAAKTKALTVEKLLADARDAGLKLTPEVLASIDSVAEAYGNSAAALEQVQLKQQNVIDGIQTFKQISASALTGFISDLRSGVSAAEALGNVFNKLADQLINIAAQKLVESAFGALLGGVTGVPVTGIGSLIGSLFGGKGFASGTGNTGGLRGQPAGIVHGQEAVIPLPNGGKVPVSLNGGAGGNGQVSVVLYLDDDMLTAKIVNTSGPVAAQISQKGITQYDTQLQQRTNDKDQRYG